MQYLPEELLFGIMAWCIIIGRQHVYVKSFRVDQIVKQDQAGVGEISNDGRMDPISNHQLFPRDCFFVTTRTVN